MFPIRRDRRFRRLVAIAVIAAMAGAGAPSADAQPAPAAPAARPVAAKLTFIHWWTSPGETAALDALIKLFSEKYPGVAVVPTVPAHAGNLRMLFPMVKKLEDEKQAPDAMQMFAGYAAQVFFDAQLLSPIDDVWAAEKLEDVTT